MIYTLTKTVTFEAAHFLPEVAADHPCRRMHGHSYTVTASIEGEPDPGYGWVRDFAEIARPLRALAGTLDHTVLNDLIENPTSENLCAWIWEALAGGPERGRPLPELVSVTVAETTSSSCTIRRN